MTVHVTGAVSHGCNVPKKEITPNASSVLLQGKGEAPAGAPDGSSPS